MAKNLMELDVVGQIQSIFNSGGGEKIRFQNTFIEEQQKTYLVNPDTISTVAAFNSLAGQGDVVIYTPANAENGDVPVVTRLDAADPKFSDYVIVYYGQPLATPSGTMQNGLVVKDTSSSIFSKYMHANLG